MKTSTDIRPLTELTDEQAFLRARFERLIQANWIGLFDQLTAKTTGAALAVNYDLKTDEPFGVVRDIGVDALNTVRDSIENADFQPGRASGKFARAISEWLPEPLIQ